LVVKPAGLRMAAPEGSLGPRGPTVFPRPFCFLGPRPQRASPTDHFPDPAMGVHPRGYSSGAGTGGRGPGGTNRPSLLLFLPQNGSARERGVSFVPPRGPPTKPWGRASPNNQAAARRTGTREAPNPPIQATPLGTQGLNGQNDRDRIIGDLRT